jgi:O-antigen ligase
MNQAAHVQPAAPGVSWSAWGKAAIFAAEAVVIGWLLLTEDARPTALLLGGTIALLLVLFLVARPSPWGGLALVAAASAMCRFTVNIGGLNARPEHFAIALAAAFLGWWLLRQHSRPQLATFDCLLLAYLGMQYFSSAFMSPEPRMTLRWATMSALAVVPYFLFRFALRSGRQVRSGLTLLLTVGCIEAAYGVVSFISNYIFGTEFGMEIGQYEKFAGTYGTQFEANLFGAYCGASALMFLAMYINGERQRRYLAGFMITVLALAVSLSRAAMAGFGLGCIFIFYRALRSGRLRWSAIAPLVGAAALGILVLSPALVPRLIVRVSTLKADDVLQDPTTLGRISSYYAAYRNIVVHPVLGNGTNSFKLLTQAPEGFDLWVGNTPVRVLHDTGIVGLAIFSAFVIALVRHGRRVVRQGGELSEPMFALLAGASLYLVSFLAAEPTILAFPWVHLGLIAAGAAAAHAGGSATP